MPTVYVYSLSDPDTGEVRYIGKTKRPRVRYQQHLRRKARDYNPYKTAWVKGLLDDGLLPVFEVREEWPNDAEACIAEMRLIARYRALGHRLTNLTDGGEGCLGRTYTPQQLERIAAANRRTHQGKVTPTHVRAKMSAAQKGRKQPPEHIARWMEAMKPVIASGEWRAKIASGLRGRKQDPQVVAKRVASAAITRQRKRALGLPEHSPEGRARIAEAARLRWLQPGRREQAALTNKGAEARARIAAEQTARWANPEYRERQLAAMAAAARVRQPLLGLQESAGTSDIENDSPQKGETA